MMLAQKQGDLRIKFLKVTKDYIHVYAIDRNMKRIPLNPEKPTGVKIPIVSIYNTSKNNLEGFGYKMADTLGWNITKMQNNGCISLEITDVDLVGRLFTAEKGEEI